MGLSPHQRSAAAQFSAPSSISVYFRPLSDHRVGHPHVVETTMSAATRPALENSNRMFAAGSSPNQIERREAANFATSTARARVMGSYSM
jgi:hypothetical protein